MPARAEHRYETCCDAGPLLHRRPAATALLRATVSAALRVGPRHVFVRLSRHVQGTVTADRLFTVRLSTYMVLRWIDATKNG